MSTRVNLLLGEPEVEHYLKANELLDAQVDLETIVLRQQADEQGRPFVLFVVRLDDGSRVLAKAPFKVMQTVMAGMLGALQRRRSTEPMTTCGAARQLQAVYPCGCSHRKVELGMCNIYAPDGSVRKDGGA